MKLKNNNAYKTNEKDTCAHFVLRMELKRRDALKNAEKEGRAQKASTTLPPLQTTPII